MEETNTIQQDRQPDSRGALNEHDPVPGVVDWLLGAVLGVIGIAMSAVGIHMYTEIDQATIAEVVAQEDVQVNGLTESEFVNAADPFVDWLAAGIGLTGLIAVIGAVWFVVSRRRTRRQVSREGGTTATFWACAVYGGALTTLISFVIPFVSSIGGGASAAYLRNGESSARTGAAAGAMGTVLTLPLLVFLGAGTIAGGEAIGESAAGVFFAGIIVGGGLIATAINAVIGALGGVLAGRFA
jgi:hypothetical protein